MDQFELPLDPDVARRDVRARRLLVETPFAVRAGAPTEMLDDVRDERGLSVDAGDLQGVRKDPARRADERVALDVLLVARLLADEHQRGRHRALPEHRLGRPFPELASTAVSGLRPGPDECTFCGVRTHVALRICKVGRAGVDIADHARA